MKRKKFDPDVAFLVGGVVVTMLAAQLLTALFVWNECRQTHTVLYCLKVISK